MIRNRLREVGTSLPKGHFVFSTVVSESKSTLFQEAFLKKCFLFRHEQNAKHCYGCVAITASKRISSGSLLKRFNFASLNTVLRVESVEMF